MMRGLHKIQEGSPSINLLKFPQGNFIQHLQHQPQFNSLQPQHQTKTKPSPQSRCFSSPSSPSRFSQPASSPTVPPRAQHLRTLTQRPSRSRAPSPTATGSSSVSSQPSVPNER